MNCQHCGKRPWCAVRILPFYSLFLCFACWKADYFRSHNG